MARVILNRTQLRYRLPNPALEYKEFGLEDGWFRWSHDDGEDRVYEQVGFMLEDGTVMYNGVTFQEYLRLRDENVEQVTPKPVKFDE